MRVHVMERRLLTRERMDRMIDAKDLSDAAKVLAECGYGELSEVTPSAVEAMLADAQTALFQDLGAAVDDPAMLDVFRIQYDYHNVKVLVKAEALGQTQDRLLLGGGRFAPDALAAAFREGGLDRYPQLFHEAISRARDALSASGDPQLADFILDRAAFAELTRLTQASGSPFLRGYAAISIDSANLRAVVRSSRLGKGPDFLRQVLVSGGTVPVEALASAREETLPALFRTGPLAEAAAAGAQLMAPGSGPLTDFERLCDDGVMTYLSAGRRIAFGQEPIMGYLYARQAEQTAIRTILSGRMAGLDGETIRRRLRRTYA